MEELVVYEKGQCITNSILVAKKFGKEHRNVLRDIRAILEDGVLKNEQTPMFEESTYVNEQNGQVYPMYIMNRDGFTLLAMGFTGSQAMRFKLDFLFAFNKMEKAIKSMTASLPNFANPAEAARAWAEMYEQKQLETKRAEAAERLIVEQQPKVVFADAVTGSQSNILIRDLAKLIRQNGVNIGEIRLYQWLRENKYLTLDNKPMQRYLEQGLFFVTEGTHSERGIMRTHLTTKVTPKGQSYFINKFIYYGAESRN